MTSAAHENEIGKLGYSHAYDDEVDPDISVLIPTFNRSETLLKNLRKLERQDALTRSYEIVVVDDGSSDLTESVLDGFSHITKTRFLYILLAQNGGPARARNIGLRYCRGTIILNLGDDIEPSNTFVNQHLRWHQKHPNENDALLGFTSIPEVLKNSGFMRWIEKGGTNFFFQYRHLRPNQVTDPIYFYTCNLSLKKSLFQKYGNFDESFPYASHEDLELGYRFASHGMRLIYDPTIRGHHWHTLTIEGVTRRIYYMGYSADIFWKKLGEGGSRLRKLARRLLAWFCSTLPMINLWLHLQKRAYRHHKSYPLLWQFLLYTSFFIGLSDSFKRLPVRI